MQDLSDFNFTDAVLLSFAPMESFFSILEAACDMRVEGVEIAGIGQTLLAKAKRDIEAALTDYKRQRAEGGAA